MKKEAQVLIVIRVTRVEPHRAKRRAHSEKRIEYFNAMLYALCA
jgi:hypothetical protein